MHQSLFPASKVLHLFATASRQLVGRAAVDVERSRGKEIIGTNGNSAMFSLLR